MFSQDFFTCAAGDRGSLLVFGLLTIGPPGSIQYFDPFQSFGLAPVLGTGTAGDLALSAIVAWWHIFAPMSRARTRRWFAAATWTRCGAEAIAAGR